MTRLTIAATLAIIAAAPSPAQQETPASGETIGATDTEAARIVADCSARKFESSIEIDKDGQKRLTKFKLCAAKDSDDAAWVRTLQDAKAKIAGHPDISAESKASIARQLDVEIAKYPEATPPPVEVATAVPPPAAATPPPATVTTVTPAPTVAKLGAAKPRLTIRCLEPGESGAGSSCGSLDRATRLQVSADADLGSGASLRFLRRGDRRGEVALAQMRQGELFRTKLPPELCAGVASSQVQIQVVTSNQIVETFGPYKLRC